MTELTEDACLCARWPPVPIKSSSIDSILSVMQTLSGIYRHNDINHIMELHDHIIQKANGLNRVQKENVLVVFTMESILLTV